MKQVSRIVLIIAAIAAVMFVRLGHVSAAQISEPSGSSTQKIELNFSGPIESMDGTTWVIDGKSVSVDPALAPAGAFAVGDIVKVEGYLLPDGSISAKQVELPGGADDNGNSNDDNSNSNANDNSDDSNSNDDDANSNDSNSNDDNSNSSSDDNGNDSNSNDDNSNSDHDDNSNDSNSNDDNSNDDHGDDDNSNDNAGNENESNSNGG